MTQHTITSRPPTNEENAIILAGTKHSGASYITLVVMGVACGFFFWNASNWLLGKFNVHSPNTTFFVCGLDAILTLYLIFNFHAYEQRQLRRARKDAVARLIEEIAVFQPEVIEIGLINDNEPILAFDIGDNKILFLQGQWLHDGETYGVPRLDGEFNEKFLNGYPEPFSFPSTSFKVTRLPHSGRVLSITVTGKYLAPKKEVNALQREYDFRDSEVFDGELDDIAEILSRAHIAQKSA